MHLLSSLLYGVLKDGDLEIKYKDSKLKTGDNPAMKTDNKEDFSTEVAVNIFLRYEVMKEGSEITNALMPSGQ